MSERIAIELFKTHVKLHPENYKQLSRKDLWKAFVEFARRITEESESNESGWMPSLG